MRPLFLKGFITIFTLLVLSYVFAMFQGGFVSWFLFYMMLCLTVYSIFVALFSFLGLKAERVLEKQSITAGDELQVTFHFHRTFPFPLGFVQVKEIIDSPLLEEKLTLSAFVYPWFKRKFTLTYKISDLPRGLYRWDEITLQTGDPFGFIKREKKLKQRDELIVYPFFQALLQWKSSHGKNIGMYSVANRQADDVTSVAGVRHYVPGDKLSRIHWKASAKGEQLKTKEFEQQASNDYLFFLDRELMSYEPDVARNFEQAVSLVASLSRFALIQRSSCGLISLEEEGSMTRIPLGKGQEQLYQFFAYLAEVRPNISIPFSAAILQETVYLPLGATLVIVTGRLDEQLLQALTELSYRKVSIECFFVKIDVSTREKELEYFDLLRQMNVIFHLVDTEDFNEVLGNRRGNLR